jgi:hypothetical protein
MEQRRLRLGDTLDDYCPRERRITNHVVVAMVEDEVKHTRCSTCDADHEYKQARVPAPRKRKASGVLASGVAEAVPRLHEMADDAPDEVLAAEGSTSHEEVFAPEPDAEPSPAPVEHAASLDDDGPVHRRLIRATLPRPEGQVPERKEPEFTVRQQGGRGREIDGNREPQAHKRHRRPPHRGGGNGGGNNRPGEMRFGAHGGNGHRTPGHGPRSGQSPNGQPNGPRDGRPNENRFRRRRGR